MKLKSQCTTCGRVILGKPIRFMGHAICGPCKSEAANRVNLEESIASAELAGGAEK